MPTGSLGRAPTDLHRAVPSAQLLSSEAHSKRKVNKADMVSSHMLQANFETCEHSLIEIALEIPYIGLAAVSPHKFPAGEE